MDFHSQKMDWNALSAFIYFYRILFGTEKSDCSSSSCHGIESGEIGAGEWMVIGKGVETDQVDF